MAGPFVFHAFAMCGRFTQAYTWAEVHAFLDLMGPLLPGQATYGQRAALRKRRFHFSPALSSVFRTHRF